MKQMLIIRFTFGGELYVMWVIYDTTEWWLVAQYTRSTGYCGVHISCPVWNISKLNRISRVCLTQTRTKTVVCQNHICKYSKSMNAVANTATEIIQDRQGPGLELSQIPKYNF